MTADEVRRKRERESNPTTQPSRTSEPTAVTHANNVKRKARRVGEPEVADNVPQAQRHRYFIVTEMTEI